MKPKDLIADKPKRSLSFELFCISALVVIVARSLAGQISLIWSISVPIVVVLAVAAIKFLKARSFRLICIVLVAAALGWLRADIAVENKISTGASVRGTIEGRITMARESQFGWWYKLKTDNGLVRVTGIYGAAIPEGNTVRLRCGQGSGLEDIRQMPVCRRATVLGQTSGGALSVIDGWRQALSRNISAVFPPPISPWISGLLLGDDSAFSKQWKEIFKTTGTSHLTAVSGYNVSVVLWIAGTLIRKFPVGRKARLSFAFCLVGIFVLLTGAPASVLRAATMAGAVHLAKECGRPVKALRALLLAVMVLVAINPMILVSDLGFQLSVMATFGLVAMSGPIADGLFFWLPATLGEWAATTVAATVSVAPLVAGIFGTYSLAALPANVAVMFFVPVLMSVGAAIILIGFIYLPVAQFLAGVGSVLFTLPLIVLRSFSRLPLALLSGWPAFLLLAAVEAACLVLIFRWWKRSGERYWLYAE